MSENPAYPGRFCSQAPLGCPSCNNKGHCVTNTNGQEVCECFPWHSGQRCQVNLKGKIICANLTIVTDLTKVNKINIYIIEFIYLYFIRFLIYLCNILI